MITNDGNSATAALNIYKELFQPKKTFLPTIKVELMIIQGAHKARSTLFSSYR